MNSVMEESSPIIPPDLTIDNNQEVYDALRRFGLCKDQFTFAPAIGGVLVFDASGALIWFPNIVMKALGAKPLESQVTESIGNSASRLGGKYLGSAVGATVAVFTLITLRKVLKVTSVSVKGGFAVATGAAGGIFAVSVLGGTFLGGLLGKKAVRKLGYRDPPRELTSYSKQVIHHIEVIDPSLFVKTLDISKNAKTVPAVVRKANEAEDRSSVVICIITRFKPRTGELDTFYKKTPAKDLQDQTAHGAAKLLTALANANKKWLNKVRIKYFSLSTTVDAVRFRNSDIVTPLLTTISNHGIPVEKKLKAGGD